MSFIGAINAEVRRWLGNVAPTLNDRFIFIGCSGNFTVEQIITRYANPQFIWSNDISLYTSVLGAYLTDDQFRLEIKDPSISFAEPYLKTTEDKVATILILSEALKYESQKNVYQIRLWRHYKSNFKRYHDSTINKLQQRKQHVRVDKYTSRDLADTLLEIPKDSVVISFMPTYFGGYEKIYKRMDEVFLWDRPEYKIIDADGKQGILDAILKFDFIYIDDQQREELPCKTIVRKHGLKAVYLYSNISFEKKSYIVEKKHIEQSSFERLTDADEITNSSRITIKPTTNNIINYFRNLYLSKTIDYVNGNDCFLTFVDSKLFGFLIFSPSKFGGSDFYMLCDFVLASERYPRLSKLLLLISRSDWIQRFLQEKYLSEIPQIFTTIFTQKPVSMKYRGIYELHSRKEGRLNYIADAGTYKLNKVVSLWLKKYHKENQNRKT